MKKLRVTWVDGIGDKPPMGTIDLGGDVGINMLGDALLMFRGSGTLDKRGQMELMIPTARLVSAVLVEVPE